VFTTKDTKSTKFGIVIIQNLRVFGDLLGESNICASRVATFNRVSVDCTCREDFPDFQAPIAQSLLEGVVEESVEDNAVLCFTEFILPRFIIQSLKKRGRGDFFRSSRLADQKKSLSIPLCQRGKQLNSRESNFSDLFWRSVVYAPILKRAWRACLDSLWTSGR
jgi:hypothetical protein